VQQFPVISFEFPHWFADATAAVRPMPSIEDRMAFVVGLAAQNVDRGTGGPFAAGIFDADGSLIAGAVNMVVPSSAPIAHAEIIAIASAGQTLGTWDLAAAGAVELVSSTEPCAMCLGAVPWSGVRRLVCGATDDDARAVGFDEGHKPSDWVEHLESIGIEVMRHVGREDAAAVLSRYAKTGGDIYNGESVDTGGPSQNDTEERSGTANA
jgi:tRNA(Arg) A34 adenosine deaminase TadA